MELKRILKEIGYENIPTLTDIHVSMTKVGFHIVLVTLYIVGLRNIKGTHDDIFQRFLEADNENEQYRVDFFSHGKCEQYLKFLVKYLNHRGYLDHFD